MSILTIMNGINDSFIMRHLLRVDWLESNLLFFLLAFFLGTITSFGVVDSNVSFLMAFIGLSGAYFLSFQRNNQRYIFIFWFVFWFFVINIPCFQVYFSSISNNGFAWVLPAMAGTAVYAAAYAFSFWVGQLNIIRKYGFFASISVVVSVMIFLVYFLEMIFPVGPISPSILLGHSPFLFLSYFFGEHGILAFFLFVGCSLGASFHLGNYRLIVFIVLFAFLVAISGLFFLSNQRHDGSTSVYFLAPGIPDHKVNADILLFDENGIPAYQDPDLKIKLIKNNVCSDCDIAGGMARISDGNVINGMFFQSSEGFFFQKRLVSTIVGQISAIHLFLLRLKSIKLAFFDGARFTFNLPHLIYGKNGIIYTGLVCLESSFLELSRISSLAGANTVLNPASMVGRSSLMSEGAILSTNKIASVSTGLTIIRNAYMGSSWITYPDGSYAHFHSGYKTFFWFTDVKPVFVSMGGIGSCLFISFFLLLIFKVKGFLYAF